MEDLEIEPKKKIYKSVSIGDASLIYYATILGFPPHGRSDGELVLTIGMSAVIRPFCVIYAGSVIGNSFNTGHFTIIREDNRIGNGCFVGSSTELGPGNILMDNVRVHSGCFLERVTLHSGVFVGPNTVFLDDPHPRCPEFERCGSGAVVEEGVSIGGNVTVLPHVRIGRNSVIGGGAVVTKDVPPDSVVIGTGATPVKGVSDLKCFKGYFDRPYLWRDST